MKIYESTLKREVSLLRRKISNSTTKIEINEIVEEHIKAGDDQYFSQLVTKDFDFDAFRDSTNSELTSCTIEKISNFRILQKTQKLWTDWDALNIAFGVELYVGDLVVIS